MPEKGTFFLYIRLKIFMFDVSIFSMIKAE